MFRQSGVVRSFKTVDPVLFAFESHVLYSRDLYFFLMASLLILSSLVYRLTLLRKRIAAAYRRVRRQSNLNTILVCLIISCLTS